MDSSHQVLIVDDDAAVRHSLQWLLESAGHQVMAYSSAEAFLDDLDKIGHDNCADAPASACLVLDLHMPGMNGLELQRFLARRCPCLPVIFVSSHADEQQIEQAVTAGAVAFLTKPFKDKLLLEHIQQILQPD